jgi:hypothetical protein
MDDSKLRTLIREYKVLPQDGTTYSNIMSKPTYHYLVPNDSRGRDIAVVHANGDVAINLWNMEGRSVNVVNREGQIVTTNIKVNIVPGTIVVNKAGQLEEVQIYRGPQANDQALRVSTATVDGIQMVVTSGAGQAMTIQYVAKNGNVTTVNGLNYYILDSKYKRDIVFTPGGQLLAENYAHVIMQVMLEQLGVVIKGQETTVFDVTAAYRRPVVSFLENGTIIKTFQDPQYSAIGGRNVNGQVVDADLKTVVTVMESEGANNGTVFKQQYTYNNDQLIERMEH